MREEKALSEIAEALSHEPSVLLVIAYGSRIRGDFMEDSDFDVFVLVDKKDISIKNRIIEIFYDYEMKFDIPFSVTILSKEEFEFNETLGSPFIKSIKEEGVIIYDSQQRREGVSLKI
jgi:predicted nucleotidyltransferase